MEKGELIMRHNQEQCPYCNGQGYFQLLLGGTENCPNCEGVGKTLIRSPHPQTNSRYLPLHRARAVRELAALFVCASQGCTY